MLRIGALNNDSNDISEPEPTFEIRQEAQESEALGLYHKALALQKAGSLLEAEKLYSNVLKAELLTEVPCPSNMNVEDILEHSGLVLKYTVYKNLADIAASEENYEKALDNYLEAALIDESDVSLWWKIGNIALKVTNLKLARYSFEKGLLYNPNHWPCLDNLVTVLFVIGDYAACLETIVKGLERDNMFIKGLIIRDQIFKEEPHFRMDYRDYNVLFLNENQEDYFQDEYSKYIEEALVLREKRCLLVRKEDLPKIKLSKQISYFTWACFGDCLVHLYDELTTAENPKSLCRPIDIEKYARSPEQQSLLAIPSPEANWKGLLAIPSPEANWKGTKQSGKEDDKKTLKRKKISSALFEKDLEPVAKRRSARVKSSKTKEEDVNWAETIQAFLPEFLRSDSATENEDSQDSLPDERELNSTRCPAELGQRNLQEAKYVSDFINQNIHNSGCIDILSNFIDAVANQSNGQRKWYHGLPQIYAQIYRRVRKHVQFPCLPPEASSKTLIYRFAKTVLNALELQLDDWLAIKSKVPLSFSPAQSPAKTKKADTAKDVNKPKETHDFLSDLHYLLFLTSFENIFQDFWVEFITRLYWVEARFFMLIGETKQSLRAFDKCIGVLTPNNGITTNSHLCFRLENCLMDSTITLGNVQKKVESVKRCLSLEEVNKLYEAGMYAEVVDLLSPLLKQRVTLSKSDEAAAAPSERPTQLLLLQDSLSKLGQVKKCIICSEFAINETIRQMTPTEDWKLIISGFLNCLNSTLTEDIADDLVPRDVVYRLVQSMIRIIELSMESIDNGDIVLATSIPWLMLFKIIKIYGTSIDPQTQTKEPSTTNSNSQSTVLSSHLYHFICSAHDLLGRRGLCCDDEGLLLCMFVKDLSLLMKQASNINIKIEEISKELEQCFYCLYGHPSKKTKSRRLQDHVTSQISLTWEYAQIVYEYFKPTGLPTLDNKINTITTEVQLLLRRIVAVVPQKDVEVIAFDTLQAHIDGLVDLPVVEEDDIVNKRSRVQDLFYYLADFYFKNKEFGKAIKFYMHDVCLNPSRFESWAAMALARGSRLEEKISACEPKSDGPIRKHSVSTLRCFEKAVKINNGNCMIQEEYGSTAYMLNSQASRRLREHIQDEEFTEETVSALTERRNEMIQLTEKCFTQARKCVKKAEGEPWLHSYMLGKSTEKLKKSAEVYLGFFQLAGQQLYTANANYPKRIPYHNPPEYSIEALEMYYRIHASILNLVQRTDVDIDYDLIEIHLDQADAAPFVAGISAKIIEKISSKDESSSVSTDQPRHELAAASQQTPQENVSGGSIKVEMSEIDVQSECYLGTPVDSSHEQITPSLSEQEEQTHSRECSQSMSETPYEASKLPYGTAKSPYEVAISPYCAFKSPHEAAKSTQDSSNAPSGSPTYESQSICDTNSQLIGRSRDTETVGSENSMHLSGQPKFDETSQVSALTDKIAKSPDEISLQGPAAKELSTHTKDDQHGTSQLVNEHAEMVTPAIKKEDIAVSVSESPRPIKKSDELVQPIHAAKEASNNLEDDMQIASGLPIEHIKMKTTVATSTIEGLAASPSGEGNIVEKTSIPNLSKSNMNREFASEEEEARFKKIVDRCLQALLLCLKRFPEHYKSQYKMALVTTYFSTHKNLALSRELLLGTSSLEARTMSLPAHGLFTDRSKTNLFQYLWRIPIDEIDRRGSFCSHVCKAVELLLYVLSQLKEWDTLLTISGLLHLTPSKDKKYLRDNDRAFLALKAFDMAKDILKVRISDAESISRTEKKLLLLDCHEAYKHAQKMQTSIQMTEHYLVTIFKMLLHQPGLTSQLPDKVILDQALRFCLANIENSRKLSSMSQMSSQSSQGSQQTESQKEAPVEDSKKSNMPDNVISKPSQT